MKEADWIDSIRFTGESLAAVDSADEWMTPARIAEAARESADHLSTHLRNLIEETGFIFFPERRVEETTHDSADVLRRWRATGNAPSLSALCIFAAENFGLKLSQELQGALLTAGILGEVKNSLPYHNNLHFKKVLFQLLRLVSAHNGIYEGTYRTLDDREIVLLMIAACIHDLGHEGKGNTVKGVHQPGLSERKSIALAAPFLKAFGLGEASLWDIRAMLLSTDVSPIGDPGNYANQMKAAYRFHFLGEKKGLQSLNLDPDLSILQMNAPLATMCLLLHESDIATSAGLNYEVTKYETTLYAMEIGEENARPSHVIDFLNAVCQQRMLSDAGQRLYAANMARIYALAKEDVNEGDHPFPPPEYSDFVLGRKTSGGESRAVN